MYIFVRVTSCGNLLVSLFVTLHVQHLDLVGCDLTGYGKYAVSKSLAFSLAIAASSLPVSL